MSQCYFHYVYVMARHWVPFDVWYSGLGGVALVILGQEGEVAPPSLTPPHTTYG